MATNWRGVTSSSRGRVEISSSERTGRPVTISPPSDRTMSASASAIRCDPPRATGHPTACALASSTRPNAALIGAVSGSIECAAQPASSARARSPEKRARASPAAERTAEMPNRASNAGCRRCGSGASTASNNAGLASGSSIRR